MKEILFLDAESRVGGRSISWAGVDLSSWDLWKSSSQCSFRILSFEKLDFSSAQHTVLAVIHAVDFYELKKVHERLESIRAAMGFPVWVASPCDCSERITEIFDLGIDEVFPLPGSEALLCAKLDRELSLLSALSDAAQHEIGKQTDLFWNESSNAMLVHRFDKHRFLTFEDVNQRALELYGYSKEAFSKLTVLDLAHPSFDLERLGQEIRDTLFAKGSTEIEAVHMTKGGSPLHVEVRAKLMSYAGQQYVFTVVRDVSERFEIQKQLELREAQLTMGLAVGRMACWSLDLVKNVLVFNDEFYALFGTTAEEHGGYELNPDYYVQHFLHPDDRHLITEEIRAIAETRGQTVFRELSYRTVHKDGSTGFMYIRYYVNELQDGKKEIFGICQDTTHQRKTELENLEIKRRQAITQTGIDLSVVPIFQLDEDGRIEYVNEFACTEYGYTREEFLSMKIHDLDPSMGPEAFQSHRTITRRKGYRKFETIHRCKNGNVRNVEVTVRYFEFEGRMMTFSFVMDLTKQKLQQERLEESERRFRRIVTNAPGLGVYGLKNDGTVFFWNHAASQMFGYSEQEVIGKNILGLIHDNKPSPEAVERMKAILKSGSSESREIVVKNKEGGEVNGLHTGVHVSINGRDEYYSLWIDLKRLKDAEREKEEAFNAMVLAKDEAEKANRAKDDFLAVMSHEMRTPLNSIIGFADLGCLDSSQLDRENIEIIHNAGLRLKNLIDDILDISRIGRDEIKPNPQEFQLVDFFRKSFKQMERSKSSLEFSFHNGFRDLHEIPDGLVVNEDPHIVGRILDNLLTNACKYTLEGSVQLFVGLREFASSSAILRFEVVDSGIGIEAGMIDHLFEPFTQVDKSFGRSGSGVGLGLAICKRLVDLLEGKIEVQSEPAQGSRFSVEFPVTLSTPEPRNTKETFTFEWHQFQGHPKVLIVDDTANNSKIVSIMIGKMGIQSVLAVDGLDAVEKCMSETFDLILMDLSMPRMDGIEATQRVRSGDGLNKETPIIGLSAHVSENVRQICLQAGMNGYLEKPIRPSSLQDCLLEHLR